MIAPTHNPALRFARISLLLPLIVPAVLALLYAPFTSIMTPTLPQSILSILFVLMASGFIGGIPYIIFYIIAWNVLKRRNETQTLQFLSVTPVVFTLFVFLFLIVFLGIENFRISQHATFIDSLRQAGAISVYVLPVGYGYVIPALIFYFIHKAFVNKHKLKEHSV